MANLYMTSLMDNFFKSIEQYHRVPLNIQASQSARIHSWQASMLIILPTNISLKYNIPTPEAPVNL